jgi:CRISPR-associated protein Cas1
MSGDAAFIPLRPIPIKDRAAMVFLEYGQLDVIDGAFVLVDQNGVRVQIPAAGLVCILLEPGTRVSHAAVALAARVGCLLVWVGEGGVRLYAAGQPGGARADRLLHQARLALDNELRLKVVRRMYERRFGEAAPLRRSVDQLRGLEGVRVRELYKALAKAHGVTWKRRDYDPDDWCAGDVPNQCLSAATSCLYGLAEAAILAAGYAPAIGFLHRGKPQSFVYDIADLFKFESVVPVAFRIAGQIERGQRGPESPERQVRAACRDSFRKTNLLERLIPAIEDVLSAGGIPVPEDAPEAAPAAIPPERPTGDDGHRS